MPTLSKILILLAVLAALTGPVLSQTALIEGVPMYYWYLGCGPTGAGMVIGYWDAQGFDDLILGVGNQWEENKNNIKQMIASSGHERDYYNYTPDRWPTDDDPLHEDDCVADFMMSSRDPFGQGISVVMYQYRGMSLYADYCGYPLSSGGLVNYGEENGDELWEVIMREIDAARPVELHVDTDGNGVGDHYIVAVGYDITDGARDIAFHLGGNYIFDGEILPYNQTHWMEFKPFSTEYAWGIGAGIWFNLFTADQTGWGNGGDLDGDGSVNSNDIDLLLGMLDAEIYIEDADINNDYRLNDYDLHMLIEHLVEIEDSAGVTGTNYGDFNLDGNVDIVDFLALKQNYGQQGGWAEGDLDGNGYVNILDFLVLKQNYGSSIWSEQD